MSLDIHLLRKQYPALSDGTAYLDGAGGTQLPDSVIDTVSDAYRSWLGNAHGEFPASHRANRLVAGTSLAPYNDADDVTRLLSGVAELAP